MAAEKNIATGQHWYVVYTGFLNAVPREIETIEDATIVLSYPQCGNGQKQFERKPLADVRFVSRIS